SSFPETQGAFARRALKRLGVSVRTNAVVTSVDEAGVMVRENGVERRLPPRTVLWAAGVAASPLGRAVAEHVDQSGRVRGREDLTVPGLPSIYVVGALATLEGPGGRPYPDVAQVALEEEAQAAPNILRVIDGAAPRPFAY